METMMTTVVEWLAAQEMAARALAGDAKSAGHEARAVWFVAQASAYEAAHAYAIVRPDRSEDAATLDRIRALLPPTHLTDADSVVQSVANAVRGAQFWCDKANCLMDEIAQTKTDAPPPAEDLAGQDEPEPTWPEWAEQCLRITRKSSGYDGFDDADGIDLPAELQEHLHELEGEIEQLRRERALALAGQGEPVAWAWERKDERGVWRPRVSHGEPGEHPWHRNIRPLFAAPASSRPADRAEANRLFEDIKDALYAADVLYGHPAHARLRELRALALRDAPRDGGEPVPAAHLREVTDADVEWLAREAIRQDSRTLARIAAALLVGRT